MAKVEFVARHASWQTSFKSYNQSVAVMGSAEALTVDAIKKSCQCDTVRAECHRYHPACRVVDTMGQ